MRYFPVFLDLDDAKVIIFGGGETAAQKWRLLTKTSARVTLVAHQLTSELEDASTSGALDWINRDIAAQPVSGDDLVDAQLIYVADVDDVSAKHISDLGRQLNIPVNVVDVPELCSFLTPALIDRSPVTIAIGTEGAAPALARRIKAKIEFLLPQRLGALARATQKLRHRVRKVIASDDARTAFWNKIFTGNSARHFLSGDDKRFTATFDDTLAQQTSELKSYGRVALVGAGPGDPELLTLKAQRLLQDADVIVHDRLIGPHILDYARRDATRIAVGKTPGKPGTRQSEINRILISKALAGKNVVRLKGGDPFVFGRGGEEQAVLEATGIAVDIVPGITAAAGCAASIKLPLTTRGQNRSLTLLTGMSSDGFVEHDWAALAERDAACAIYMGVSSASHIQTRLLQAGCAPDKSVIIVQNGTLENERVVISKVALMSRAVSNHDITGPAIIFIGLNPSEAFQARDTVVDYLQDDKAPGIIAFPTPHHAHGERL